MANLRNLEEVDFSHNLFTGRQLRFVFPEICSSHGYCCAAELPEMDRSVYPAIKSVDLTSNKLSGENKFYNASAFSCYVRLMQ